MLRRSCLLPIAAFVFVLTGSIGIACQQNSSPDVSDNSVREQKLAERAKLAKEALALDGKGELDQAISVGLKVASLELEIFGEGHSETFGTILWIADRHDLTGQLDKALGAREEILPAVIRLHGEEHWITRIVRHGIDHSKKLRKISAGDRERLKTAYLENLRFLELLAEKKHSEGLVLAKQILDTRREILGKDHLLCAMSLWNLGVVYELSGDYTSAAEHLLECKQIRADMIGIDAPDCVQTATELAGVYKTLGKYDEALPLYEQLLKIRKESVGKEHPDYALALNNLAVLCQDMGDSTRAEKLHLEALAIREKNPGNQHPDYAFTLNNLASIYKDASNYDLAEEMYVRSLAIRKKVHGDNHPDTAASLLGLATLYERTGDFKRAERLYLESKAIRSKLYGQEHRETALILNNLGTFYLATGKYKLSEQHLLKSKSIYLKLHGETHPDYALSLHNLATVYEINGKLKQALPLFLEAKSIRERMLGRNHPAYTLTLNNLAGLYKAMADYDKAEQLYLESKRIRAETIGVTHPDYAASLNNLGDLYQTMGEYQRAEEMYSSAEKLLADKIGKEHPTYVACLNNLASLARATGDYLLAEKMHLQVKSLREKLYGPKHPSYAESLNHLASLYQAQGDYARAESLYLESADIFAATQGKVSRNYATSRNNLAGLYRAMFDNAKAEELYLEAISLRKQLYGKEHPEYADSLDNLAGLYYETGQMESSEPLLVEAKKIRETTLDKFHPSYTISANNLANFYLSTGRYEQAKILFLEIMAIEEETLGTAHPDYAIGLSNLAVLNEVTGDYSRAEELYLEAKTIRKETLGDNHPEYALSLSSLAGVYRAQKRFAAAEDMYFDAIKLSRRHIDATAIIQSEQLQMEMARNFRYQLDDLFSMLVDRQENGLEGDADGDVSKESSAKAFAELLSWKGATLIRQAEMRRIANEAGEDSVFDDMQRVSMRLATLSRMVPARTDIERWNAELKKLREEKDQLEKQLAAKSETFRKAQRAVTLQQLFNALPKETAIVDFLEYMHYQPSADDISRRYETRLLAFVVRPDNEIHLITLGKMKKFEDQIEAWRRDFGMIPDSRSAGQKLREGVWEPVEKHLGDCKTVLVSPDGALGKIPFGALPGKETGNYLIEEYRLAVLPVTQMLADLSETDQDDERNPGGLLLMGDVDYDAELLSSTSREIIAETEEWRTAMRLRDKKSFSALPATADEVYSIEEMYGSLFADNIEKIAVLRKSTATELQFRVRAANHSHLHLATHGFFADPSKRSKMDLETVSRQRNSISRQLDKPAEGFSPGLLSGLAFAGANQVPQIDQDDGILTAEEIAYLPLDHVDLVVMSACETGLGKVAGGEGLIGIQRAFQVAGAHSTIASLWNVEDRATMVLMTRFYRNLWEEKQSKLDALRNSQLWMLNHPDEIWSEEAYAKLRGDGRRRPITSSNEKRLSPEYWAAFSLSGEWR